MACLYAIEAYGPDEEALHRAVEAAFDEVDRIDRLMSHYKAESAVSLLNREAARRPVVVERELYDFIAEAMRYTHESHGAFDITVGPLMKVWGFFRGDGRVPSEDELAAARRHVGGVHVKLDPIAENDRLRRSRRRDRPRRHSQGLRRRPRRSVAQAAASRRCAD